jgi:hypothetical protein
MKKLFASLLLVATISSYAQTEVTDTTIVVPQDESYVEPKKEQRTPDQKKSAMPTLKKFYIGGTFGATFGKYSSITISPEIGYAIKPSLYTGLRFYYTYSKQIVNLGAREESYEYHTYGIGTFLRWYAFKDLYLHIAPELINYQNNYQDPVTGGVVESTNWVPFVWAGAGYRKMAGKRSWISVHVLFDLLQDNNSPYKQWEPNVVIGAGTSF